MNSPQKNSAILLALLMLGPFAGYLVADIKVINAKTGKISAVHDSAFATFGHMLVDINTETRQFNTLRRTNNNAFIYTRYDENCRKLKEYKFPLLFKNYGSVHSCYAVRNDKIAYINEKTQCLHLYDIKTGINKIITSSIIPADKRHIMGFFQWISDAKILFILDKVSIIDVASGEQKIVYDIPALSYTRAALSPDGAMLAFTEKTTSIFKVIRIMELNSGKISKTLGREHGMTGGLKWSPDSKELAYIEGIQEKQINAYNVAEDRERTIKNLPEGYYYVHLAFGNGIIAYDASSKDKTSDTKMICFINSKTGESIREINLDVNSDIWLLDNDCLFACKIF